MPTHQPHPVRILIADNEVLPAHRLQQMVASYFEVVGTLPSDTEQAVSQTLWLLPDIVLINIAVRVDDWSQLVKRILEKLPRTRVVVYQNDGESNKMAPESASLQELSNRQHEVLALLAAGYPMKEVAYRLGITYRTATFHKYKMMERLGISSTAGLMSYALKIRWGFATASDPGKRH
jgi:DNA-binding NarL/FixJ family response regulator